MTIWRLCSFFLDRGADVNAIGGLYGCALEAAAHRGSIEVLEVLRRIQGEWGWFGARRLKSQE